MRSVLIATVLLVVAYNEDRSREPRPLEITAQQCRSKELGCPRPIFAVSNLQAGLAYYRDTLGFKIDWEWGEPADFASVTRGDTTIFIGEEPLRGGGQLWVFTREVDKLHSELVKRKAIIKMPPTNMPWGNREMHVLDRDGNMLRFAGPEPK